MYHLEFRGLLCPSALVGCLGLIPGLCFHMLGVEMVDQHMGACGAGRRLLGEVNSMCLGLGVCAEGLTFSLNPLC